MGEGRGGALDSLEVQSSSLLWREKSSLSAFRPLKKLAPGGLPPSGWELAPGVPKSVHLSDIWSATLRAELPSLSIWDTSQPPGAFSQRLSVGSWEPSSKGPWQHHFPATQSLSDKETPNPRLAPTYFSFQVPPGSSCTPKTQSRRGRGSECSLSAHTT